MTVDERDGRDVGGGGRCWDDRRSGRKNEEPDVLQTEIWIGRKDKRMDETSEKTTLDSKR